MPNYAREMKRETWKRKPAESTTLFEPPLLQLLVVPFLPRSRTNQSRSFNREAGAIFGFEETIGFCVGPDHRGHLGHGER